MKQYKRVLSIAGSDVSGGAGIQADLKAISACGCFAQTAITAVVDENTVGVYGVHPIPVDFVKSQIDSALNDIGADAVKIGMLYSSELVKGVAESLIEHKAQNIVLDPVMIATNGGNLLLDDAVASLVEYLLPISRIITPNIPEAEVLIGKEIRTINDMRSLVRELSFDQSTSVLLKAGHLTGDDLTDILYNCETDEVLEFTHPRIHTLNTHGTGCTLSSAIASYLALGFQLNEAVEKALDYIAQAIKAGAAYKIGGGTGPVHHFYRFW